MGKSEIEYTSCGALFIKKLHARFHRALFGRILYYVHLINRSYINSFIGNDPKFNICYGRLVAPHTKTFKQYGFFNCITTLIQWIIFRHWNRLFSFRGCMLILLMGSLSPRKKKCIRYILLELCESMFNSMSILSFNNKPAWIYFWFSFKKISY